VEPEPDAVVDVVRSDFVESHHRASVVALDADGHVVLAHGDVRAPIFPRSSNKPLQAAAMLRAGLDLDGELLALAAASHSGEPFHVEGVRRILAGAGLAESALQTPPDLPIEEQARQDYLRDGGKPLPIVMNCSGKHAAMLATCVVNGWPTASYREADHPLQVRILATVEDLADERVAAVGVDGCGAPVLALSLLGLARAFARVATADATSAEGRVAAAIRGYPDWLGGPRRDVTRLVAGVPGLVAKDGAEGVYAAAMPDGRAVAVKVYDGAARARAPLMVAALRRLGVDAPVLTELAAGTQLGGGDVVGVVRVRRGNRE
jgi:L-asparaginase II